MLHRVLSGFCSLPGVELAFLFNDLGSLVASVSEAGSVPNIEVVSRMLSNCTDVTQASSSGILEEIWNEGERRMIIDRIRSDLILVLEGDGGQLARWRHAVDRDRAMIAEIA